MMTTTDSARGLSTTGPGFWNAQQVRNAKDFFPSDIMGRSSVQRRKGMRDGGLAYSSAITSSMVHRLSPGHPRDEAAAETDRSKLQAVLRLASEASRSSKAVPLNPMNPWNVVNNNKTKSMQRKFDLYY